MFIFWLHFCVLFSRLVIVKCSYNVCQQDHLKEVWIDQGFNNNIEVLRKVPEGSALQPLPICPQPIFLNDGSWKGWALFGRGWLR